MVSYYFQSRVTVAVVLFVVMSSVGGEECRSASAKTSVTVLPTGDGLELAYGDGLPPSRHTIPLHRAGDIRYFSAGVGLEEREADYPPFPLKLVFVVGGKPYLTHVAVSITDESGSVKLAIPREQVIGPWLFVDLPSGTYQISAIWEGQTQTNTAVKISAERTHIVYLRWPEHPAH